MGSIRRSKTKRRTRDLDLIHGDLRNPRQLELHRALIPDEDRPALGAHHCVECAKFFEQEFNLLAHRRGKNHKRRVRMLKAEPYTQKEADAASGMGAQAFYMAREEKKVLEAKEMKEREMEIEP